MNSNLFKIAIILTVLLPTFSCKKTDANSYFYVRGTFDGAIIDWASPRNTAGSSNAKFWVAFSEPGASMPLNGPCYANDSNYQFRMGTYIFEYHSGTDTRNSIGVSFLRSGSFASENVSNEMKSLFTNGPKSFGLFRTNCSDPIVDGIAINYTDNNGIVWRSNSLSPQDHFEQISLIEKQGIGTYEKEWKVKFSCKLYDDSNNYIIAENCEIFGPVFKQ